VDEDVRACNLHPATAGQIADTAVEQAVGIDGLICLHGRISHALRGLAED
jgi:hypothetical protein